MLSSVARSPYICYQCRFHLLRTPSIATLARPLRSSTTSLHLHRAYSDYAPRDDLDNYRPRDSGNNRGSRDDYTPRVRSPKEYRERHNKGGSGGKKGEYIVVEDYRGKAKDTSHFNKFVPRPDRNEYPADPPQDQDKYINQPPASEQAVDESITELLAASARRAAREAPAPNDRQKRTKLRFGSEPVDGKALDAAKWEDCGLSDLIAETLVRAFPNATRPNRLQWDILTKLHKGNSIAVSAMPGTGKSFAIAAWLLTLQRAMALKNPQHPRLTTTALVVCPNVELLKQYHRLITTTLAATGSQAILDNPQSFVQILYRGNGAEERLEGLRRNKNPHIILATPTVLLDIISSQDLEICHLVDYDSLKAVVVEEADVSLARYPNMLDTDKPFDPKSVSPDPLLILLDYIFEARKVASIKAHCKPTQPQLVIPTASLGSSRITRIIKTYHPSWTDGENRPGYTPFTGKGLFSPSSTLLPVAETPQKREVAHIESKLPDNITHHIVAFDPIAGLLRNAPVPTYTDPTVIESELSALHTHDAHLTDALESAIAEQEAGNPTGVQHLNSLLKLYGSAAPEVKRQGYPPGPAAEVLETLLAHDQWPRNVIAAVSDSAALSDLQFECSRRGLNARYLQADEWNRDAEAEGRIPIGRTDQLVGRSRSTPVPGVKEKTTVWIANYSVLRGLDTPDINHLYILHRIRTAREYITYAGRVARRPFSHIETVRDPRSLGFDTRPRGKVVSVVMEDRGLGGTTKPEEVGNKFSLVSADGGLEEGWVWKGEALQLAKIGVRVDEYFSQEDIDRETVEGSLVVTENGAEDVGLVEDAQEALDRARRELEEARGALEEARALAREEEMAAGEEEDVASGVEEAAEAASEVDDAGEVAPEAEEATEAASEFDETAQETTPDLEETAAQDGYDPLLDVARSQEMASEAEETTTTTTTPETTTRDGYDALIDVARSQEVASDAGEKQ